MSSVVRRVVWPQARPGFAAAMWAALARAIGEAAPLLILAGALSSRDAESPDGSLTSLPLYVITGLQSGEEALATRAYGAATVLLVLVTALVVLARRAFHRASRQASEAGAALR